MKANHGAPDGGNANGHDQQMAQGLRAAVCQRAVGFTFTTRLRPGNLCEQPGAARMPGGVRGWGS